MRSIYICDNYNHLLISIIKTFQNKEEANDVLICNNWENDNLLNDKKIISNIKKSGVFSNVIVFDEYYEEEKEILKSRFKLLKKLIHINKMNKKYKDYFKKYDEIYMFYDVTNIGKILNINKIRYNLLEDGTDCYKNNKNVIDVKLDLKNKIKKHILGYPVKLADSKYIKSIEVNDKKDLFISHKNIIESPKIKMYDSLNEKQKKIIMNIFLDNNSSFKNISGCSLIITQPLYIDKYLDSEEEQVKLYESIINDYCKGDKIVIKTHPRENTDYSSIKGDYIILTRNFPLEVFNFMDDLQFNKAITISSTSLSLIKNCKEKIMLGWDYIEKNRK